ncbi:hypothetical protein AO282_08250, partial [Pseudomonas amygdali pv. morsprunorum]
MAKAKPQPVSPDNPQERIEEHPAFLPLMAKAKPQPVSPDNPQERIEEHPAFLLGKHPTEDSFLLAAPPGSGKPVGVVIPSLLR